MKISVSVLAGPLIDLKKILGEMNEQLIDFIHMDVMDGHFVPQLSFGEAYCAQVGKHTNIPLDVHLMVCQPELQVEKYFSIKPRPHVISFHIEATHAAVRLAQSIRKQNIQAGVAICPGTAIEIVEPLLDEIDLILLMSVEPGYYGQKFIANSLERVKKLKAMIGKRKITLEVDGGVGFDNIAILAEAGVDVAVSGSACFSRNNVNTAVEELKRLAIR